MITGIGRPARTHTATLVRPVTIGRCGSLFFGPGGQVTRQCDAPAIDLGLDTERPLCAGCQLHGEAFSARLADTWGAAIAGGDDPEGWLAHNAEGLADAHRSLARQLAVHAPTADLHATRRHIAMLLWCREAVLYATTYTTPREDES
jgi:hypothetical protein